MTIPSPQQPPPNSVRADVHMGEILSALWREKWKIARVGIVSFILGAYYAFEIAQPKYTATASVVQETASEAVPGLPAVLTGGLSGDQSAINTEIEVIKSRALLTELVDNLDLTTDPELNQFLQEDSFFSVNAIKAYARSIFNLPEAIDPQMTDEQIKNAVITTLLSDVLSISNTRQSYVYTITATTEDSVKSALLANTLAALYIANQQNIKGENNLRTVTWLTTSLGQLGIELEIAELAVKDFTASSDLVNAETLSALSRQVKELRERIVSDQSTLSELEIRAQILIDSEASADTQIMVQAAQDNVLNGLFSAIEDTEPTTLARFNTRFRQLIAQTETERDRVKIQINALQDAVAKQEKTIDLQSEDLITLQQLQREAEASRLLYEYFLSQLKETSVQSGIQDADSRILSEANVPLFPSAPRKSVIVIFALMLGMFVRATFVCAREMMNNTFRYGGSLEQLTGHILLGMIPKLPTRRPAKLLKYLSSKPTSVAAEAIRTMRTSLLLANPDAPPQIIMVTSSVPEEGKSLQSFALTQSLALLGKKVLFIEADVHQRTFETYFQRSNGDSLIAAIEERVPLHEAVYHETTINADVLISAATTHNVTDIFSSPGFATLLQQARESYDHIIIDAPPVLAVPDAKIIGRHVDTTAYIVRWDHTTHRQVQQGLKEMSQALVPIAGVVLSQIDRRQLKRYGHADDVSSYSGYHKN